MNQRCWPTRVAFLFFYSLLSAAQPAMAMPAQDVQPINNRDYLSRALALIDGAQQHIRVTMYLAQRYGNYADSPSNRLLGALANAQARGVDVEVILERSKQDDERSRDLNTKNADALKFLSDAGVKVFQDSPAITTHAKVLVVDARYTIIGSTNWTYAALVRNNEAAVLIDSPSVAKVYEEMFEEIKRQ